MLEHFLLHYRLRLLFFASVLLTGVMGWPQPALWLEWTALLLLVMAGINTLRHSRLLALAFAMAYQVVNGFVPEAFWNARGELHLDDFVYYSLVTLTTVGYGDIHAQAPAARLLAGAEAVAGVMFIAIAVARSLMLMNDRDEEV